MSGYLVKHFIFIVIVFAALFGFHLIANDADLSRFAYLTASFLSMLTAFILVGSIYLSRGSTASTNILLGGIAFKLLMAIAFYVVYALIVKNLNLPIVLMFVLQYFLFTGWILYLLLQYFNAKDKK